MSSAFNIPARKVAPNSPAPRGWTAIFADGEAKGWNDCLDAIHAANPVDAVPGEPVATMDDAIAAGDGTLHGAIDYWQGRALAGEAARDVDGTNKVLADNYLRDTASVASRAGSEPVATVTALDSLKREALEIFDGTETSQDVRDVIEWYSASIRVILDKARSRINAALSAPAAAAEPSDEQLNAACLRHTQAMQAGLTSRMAMRRALTVAGTVVDRERAASLVVGEEMLGRLKAALVAHPVNAVQGEQSQLAKDFPPMGGLTECDMGDSYE